MEYLQREEYIDLAPAYVGKVRVNHDSLSCSGESKSMVIERNEDGTITAKCFRCGAYGRSSESYFSSREAKEKAAQCRDRYRCSTVSLPYDSEGDVGKWGSSKARIRILKHGITQQEVTDNGIVYSDKYGGIVFPCSDSSGLVGYQVRTFEEGLPRYYTKTVDPDRMVWYRSNRSDSDACVLVEDVLSGIKTARHISTACLLGTELNASTLKRIVEAGHKEFLIFLDDDNPIVRQKQRVLKNKLELFGKVTILHGGGVDPKEMSDGELREILL